MDIPTESRQLKREAKQALALLNSRRGPLPAKRDFRIESHPRDDYKPPHFARKTAGDKQHEELRAILRELHEANEEHVGESIVELTACFTLTAP
jgi:hypothetical protein